MKQLISKLGVWLTCHLLNHFWNNSEVQEHYCKLNDYPSVDDYEFAECAEDLHNTFGLPPYDKQP